MKRTKKCIAIRVIADGNQVADHSEKIAELLQDEGYELLNISKPCPRRPPEQSDSSIYIQVLPPEPQSGSMPKLTDAVLGGNK